MVPVVEFSDSPEGSVPEAIENWYGAAPPLTEITALYGLPIVAAGKFAEMVTCVDEP